MFREEAPLLRWPLKKRATISSVSDRNAAALRELQRLGLMPGVTVTVEQKTSTASVSIRLADQASPIRLSSELAACVSVVPAL